MALDREFVGFNPRNVKELRHHLGGLAHVELNMGQTAEVVAKLFNISRVEADEYAVESHLRLAKAQTENLLADEVEPAFDRAGKVYTLDDGVRPDSTVEKLAMLKPAFE